jgi:hypothetical protein
MDHGRSTFFIPFDGTNYFIWKKKASAYIKANGWSSVMVEKEIKEKEKWSKQDKEVADKALCFLLNSLNDNILGLFTNVVNEDDAGALWHAIQKHYERDTSASKHTTRSLLFNVKHSLEDNINNYISKIVNYSEQLKGMGEQLSDGDLLYALYNGLPSEYNAMVSMLRIVPALTFVKLFNTLKINMKY